MNEIVCSVVTMDPATFAIAFGSGLALGMALDRWIIPACVRGWVWLVRAADRPQDHAGG